MIESYSLLGTREDIKPPQWTALFYWHVDSGTVSLLLLGCSNGTAPGPHKSPGSFTIPVLKDYTMYKNSSPTTVLTGGWYSMKKGIFDHPLVAASYTLCSATFGGSFFLMP